MQAVADVDLPAKAEAIVEPWNCVEALGAAISGSRGVALQWLEEKSRWQVWFSSHGIKNMLPAN